MNGVYLILFGRNGENKHDILTMSCKSNLKSGY